MLLQSIDDVNDILGQCLSNNGICLHENDLSPAFFDLRTRIAGELFQKIMNYNARLAIVVTNPEQYGERFSELIFEHQRHNAIRFFQNPEDAEYWL